VTPFAVLEQDLDAVLERTRGVWDELRGARLLVTGASGFFGRWMLESWRWADRRLSLGTRLTVVTRDAARFRDRQPEVSAELIEGDVRTFVAPSGDFSHLLHMAAEPHGPRYAADPDGMRDVVVGGTRRVFAVGHAAGIGRALLISSGAVYGPQPAHERIPEDADLAEDPDPGRRAYAAAKAAAESAALESGVPVVIARPFAFLGPHLPLDAGFAAGQFLNDALAGRPIRVADGTVVRSYLYAADLAAWLWTMLVTGRPGRAYNVGSEHGITLTALAAMIAGAFRPPRQVERSWHASGHRYVPDTSRARAELGLAESISLPEAVRRTIRWHRESGRAAPGR